MARVLTHTLTYFPIWARGSAAALALEHAGIAWTGRFPGKDGVPAWPDLKPTTPWGSLPLLEVEGGTTIAHEIAILTWLGRQAPALGGSTEAEWVLSQQLMSESDDIYSKLTQFQPTIREPDKGWAGERLNALWTEHDAGAHNRQQAIPVHLSRLEQACGGAGAGRLPAGFLTGSGHSVGECKLFSILHTLVLIKGSGLLSPYPCVSAFYSRFGTEPKTIGVVEEGGRFPGRLRQYFLDTS